MSVCIIGTGHTKFGRLSQSLYELLIKTGKEALEEGVVYKEGKLPVNLSGGLKAKDHPVGVTGVSMAVVATRQLLDKVIGHQLRNSKIGLAFNIGGSAASNYATVFKRAR